MKKILSVYIITLLTSGVLAQPSLESLSFPAAGTKITDNTISATGVSPGESGASVTWDFSGLDLSLSAPVNKEIVPVSALSSPASYPSATYAEKVSELYTVFKHTENEKVIQGQSLSIGNVFVKYSDEAIVLEAPLSFNESSADNYSGSATVSFFTYMVSGEISVKYDGYGTLILPGNTFSDVIRLYSVNTQSQSVTGIGETVTKTETYSWVKNGDVYPLMTYTIITNYSVDELGETNETSSTRTISLPEVEEVNSLFSKNYSGVFYKIWPNPSDDLIFVDLANGNSGYLMELKTVDGVAVIKKENVSGQVKIDISNLQQGVYLLSLTGKKGSATKKIIVK